MNVNPELAALQNRLVVNEREISTNSSDAGVNTQAVADNQAETGNVGGQITDVQQLRTGVKGQLSALQASLDGIEDDAERVAVQGSISDLSAEIDDFNTQERDLNNQHTDLTRTGNDLVRTGEELETDGIRLDGEHTEIQNGIASIEAEPEVSPDVAEEKPKEEITTDVPVQNNKGWQYYAELELRAEHGNDPNYKPSASELSARADEIKARNIENGNVNSRGDLIIGTPKDPKYVTLNGEIDTSGLQTTDQALVRFNQGQTLLARREAAAREQSELEAQRLDECRDFSSALRNKLERGVQLQNHFEDILDNPKYEQQSRRKSLLGRVWDIGSTFIPGVVGTGLTVWTNVYEAPRGSGTFSKYDENGRYVCDIRDREAVELYNRMKAQREE